MVTLINLKESLIRFYQKKEHVLRPLFKALLSFAVLCSIQILFQHIETERIIAIALVSLLQVFLPMAFLFFSGSFLIAYNLLGISADMCLGFVLIFLICLLTYVRMEPRIAAVTMVIPVLFYFRMEYLIPVALGITASFSGIFPAIFGTLIYYMVLYTGDASSLLINASETDLGTGLARVINLMVIDRRMLVILVTFALVIFITTLLYRLFYELAWLFSVTFGNAAMVFLLLCGRYIFELNFAIWRLFAGALASVLLCTVIQFFRGIGDVSRMERTSFEDDDYIYYVKAVPKIRVAKKNPNITNISSAFLEDEEEQSALDFDGKEDDKFQAEEESGEMRRKRRAERKRIFQRKKKPEESGQDPAGKEDSGKETAKDSKIAKDSAGDSDKNALQKGDKLPEAVRIPGEDASDESKVKESDTTQEKAEPDKEDKAKAAETPESREETETGRTAGNAEKTEAGRAAGNVEKAEAGRTAGNAEETETGRTAGNAEKAEAGRTAGSAEKAEPVKASEKKPDTKAASESRETFADAVIKGREKEKKEKIQKLDMEDIVKENIAAAKELSVSDRKRQGKE